MIIPNEKLMRLCIKHQWFTEGTNTQYDKLFYANEMGCPLDEIVTIIWLCSDSEKWCRRDIKFELEQLIKERKNHEKRNNRNENC